MEKETFWLDLDVLDSDFFFGQVVKDQVLRVLLSDGEVIRNVCGS